MRKFLYTTIICFLLTSVYIQAQSPVVKASLDSIGILVGEQTNIHLEVTGPIGSLINFPVFSDTIISGIELVETGKPDTIKADNSQEQITLDYKITGFDEGLYYIPPFSVVVNGDSIFSNSLSLKISAFEVDTISKQFYDIKPVMKPDFVWSDYLWILITVWIGLILLGVLLYYIFFKKKKIKQLIKKPEKIIPPHLKALSDLDELKKQRLCENERYKEYYTGLTDILRIYLTGRFGINAMGMTSDEILQAFSIHNEDDSGGENLKQILYLADLVKFAKLHPLPDENELSYMNARLFISQTQPDEVRKEEKIEEQPEESL
ncbi:MAG: BatD family protein [Candidatus Azobacteroides sp.]|nr:BatD family protein [Candidatus Azobacteroides sp.]